jgi:hypothetical protein
MSPRAKIKYNVVSDSLGRINKKITINKMDVIEPNIRPRQPAHRGLFFIKMI